MLNATILKALETALNNELGASSYWTEITRCELHHSSPRVLVEKTDRLFYIVEYTQTPKRGMIGTVSPGTTRYFRLAVAEWNGAQFKFPTSIIVRSEEV